MIDVLYIHPYQRCSLDYVLPMGAVGLINACPGTRLGRFQEEVTDEEIAGARVVVMDCHWYPSLPGVAELAGRVRRLNPAARLVVGGYTATVFARALVDVLGIDYVVVGDAEVPMPLLVSRLLEGGTSPDGIPNVVHPGGTTAGRYVLSPEEYARQDYRDISWHPTLERNAAQLAHTALPTQTFPWIPVFKGCLSDCSFCYGNQKNQVLLRGRPFVLRPADAVAADLEFYGKRPDRFWVHIIADFLTALDRKYSDRILSTAYDLGVYYEFYNPPSPEQIDQIAGAFRKCFLSLSLVEDHADLPQHARAVDAKRLEQTVRHMVSHRNVRVIIQYDSNLATTTPQLARVLRGLRREYGVFLNGYDTWYIEVPEPGMAEAEQPAQLAYFRRMAERSRFTRFRYVNWHIARRVRPWFEMLYHGQTEMNLLRISLANALPSFSRRGSPA